MINIQNITLTIAGKELLKNASCQISDGQKIAIVGDNGCGKSTFLKAILGQLELNSGSISFPQKTSFAYLEQEITDISCSILDFVLSKHRELIFYRTKLTQASSHELSEIYDHLNRLESSSAESKIASILDGLGFSQSDFKRPVQDFSGGWRMRLALAGALFQNPDFLLLDEPTNHLDLEAVIWLENYLKKYTGTLVIISHDQDFINRNCSSILHFENKQLTLYKGNFETFQKTLELKNELTQKQIKKIEEKKAHIQSFIDRFRYKATKAKQAQSRLKMLKKMQETPFLIPNKEDRFCFPEITPLAPPYLRLEKVSVGYTDIPVLKHINFNLDSNERIAFLGKNGNGKSTLAKLIAGQLQKMEGVLVKSPKLKIGFFNQHQHETLEQEETPVSYIRKLSPLQNESQIRTYLAQFGLEQDKAITQIKFLSGGEKARLVLAKICIDKPQLIILDEPTNHLDIKGRNALIQALNSFQGSVILITHDFYIIESVCDKLLLIQNNTCQQFDGDLEDYRTLLLTKNTSNTSKKTTQPLQKEKKFSKSSLSFKIKAIEETLEKLYQQQESLQKKLSSYSPDIDFKELAKRLEETENKIYQNEELWTLYNEQL